MASPICSGDIRPSLLCGSRRAGYASRNERYAAWKEHEERDKSYIEIIEPLYFSRLYTLFPLKMRKSGIWKYFSTTTPPTYFKNDRTHRNAWCDACVQRIIMKERELDAVRVRSGEATSIRSEDELRTVGEYDYIPKCEYY